MSNNIENSIYSVTPPSLFLNDNGPSIFLMGFTESKIKEISDIFDDYFQTNNITYYYDTRPLNKGTVAWGRAVVNMVDHIIVNADTCNELEVFIALMAIAKNPGLEISWVAENQDNKGLLRLVNSYTMKIFNNISELNIAIQQSDI